jgi:hypothetical protein
MIIKVNKINRHVRLFFHLSVLLLFMLSYESNAVVHNKALTHILNDSGIGKQDLKETAFIQYINADGTQSLMYISSKRLYKIECNTLGKLGFLKAVGYPAEAYHLFEKVHHSQENDEYLKKIGLILDYDGDGKAKRGPILTCDKSADTFLMFGNPSLRDASGMQNGNIGVFLKFRDEGHDNVKKYLYRLECWGVIDALGYKKEDLMLIRETELTKFQGDDHVIRCISGELIKPKKITIKALENGTEIEDVIEKKFGESLDIEFMVNSKLDSLLSEVESRLENVETPNEDCKGLFSIELDRLIGRIGANIPSYLKECQFKVLYRTYIGLPYETISDTKEIKIKFGEKPKLAWSQKDNLLMKTMTESLFFQKYSVTDPLDPNGTELTVKVSSDGVCDWLQFDDFGSGVSLRGIPKIENAGTSCDLVLSAYRSIDKEDIVNHDIKKLKIEIASPIKWEGNPKKEIDLRQGKSFSIEILAKDLDVNSSETIVVKKYKADQSCSWIDLKNINNGIRLSILPGKEHSLEDCKIGFIAYRKSDEDDATFHIRHHLITKILEPYSNSNSINAINFYNDWGGSLFGENYPYEKNLSRVLTLKLNSNNGFSRHVDEDKWTLPKIFIEIELEDGHEYEPEDIKLKSNECGWLKVQRNFHDKFVLSGDIPLEVEKGYVTGIKNSSCAFELLVKDYNTNGRYSRKLPPFVILFDLPPGPRAPALGRLGVN